MISTPQNKYLNHTVQTATPAQLLIMLYDGCIRFCKLAIHGLEQNDLQLVNTNLVKAQAIINELIVTLDMNIPLSQDLRQIYDYWNHQLIAANMGKQKEPVEEVLGFLTEMKETWVQAARSINAAKPAGGPYG
ncbi:flagellar export chaperone FliS [Paenibacillus sp. J2TS4]|uniref:flagellar export chaperone FliS n=1 Tax=Paenibacillus sp. J2TS4 TaxID=2807194 RepID=UPI001B259E13|nr:flagellar export chaperone FliS [Paenibacillus sp. J2TS4]GIP35614.1 flagellar protein FliS [Paenibacillus sp. J2TS4]